MRLSPTYTACALLLAMGLLAGCSQQPAASSAPAQATASARPPVPVISAAAPSAAPALAPASTAALPGDHASTTHYRIAINLPTLPAAEKPLSAALRVTADDAKREFLQALPDPKQVPEFAGQQFTLTLDFTIAAQTPTFTSIREAGGSDTGGAHPVPVQATFVFDRKAGKLVTLDDLFSQPDLARVALAKFVRAALLKKLLAEAPTPSEASPEALREWNANTVQMLDDGTRPTAVNYATFIVRAGATPPAASPGITLIFPPYQVAPYAAGTQTVDVPGSVIAKFLKPAYQADFAP